MFRRKCKITFIAHGATIYSEENRMSDIENYPPLNDLGYEETEKMCEFLKKRGVKNDRIYTSPGLRTVQSAQMIAKVFKKDFEILEDLTTLKHGNWNGLIFDKIGTEKLEEFLKNPSTFSPVGGETIVNFNERVQKTIEKVVETNLRGRIIIVTYPLVIQAAISNALNIPPQNQARIYIKTGSATQISYYEDWASLMYSGYVPL